MKRLIFIAVALTLMVGMIWAPSVAAVSADITVHKTIGPGCPEETFHFEAWRDLDSDGIIDLGEPLVGTVDIAGAGSGVITVNLYGMYIIHEVLEAGSAYEQQPDQSVFISCDRDVYFDNTCLPQECELVIRKVDAAGELLPGSCFTITPDPRTGNSTLTLCDNDPPDECPEDGVLCLSGLICGLEVTVEETVPPPGGYKPGDPQTVTIENTPELTFVNTRCELIIRKVDAEGNLLPGACFNITPDPRTGTGVMTLCDNDPLDECPEDGVLCLSGLICGINGTVEETVPPPGGYTPGDPQGFIIEDTPVLTFVNTREETCGTVCAAQALPGQFPFNDDDQDSWFTWIYYDIGWGTEDDPYTYPIYTGQTILCGTLYVYDDGTHIFVNYELTDTETCTLGGLSVYHLQVDSSFANLKKKVCNKSGNPVPGRCEYKDTFDPMVSETGYIECTKDNVSGWTTAYIFAHGVGCYYCPYNG